MLIQSLKQRVKRLVSVRLNSNEYKEAPNAFTENERELDGVTRFPIHFEREISSMEQHSARIQRPGL